MKKILFLVCFLCMNMGFLHATLTPNTEYYIWLNIYEKLIGSSADGTSPALSAYGTNDDANSYIFVAEDAGKSGYVLLRQKSSGKYFAASTSSSYSTVFEERRSTDDRYCWKVDEGTYVYLINKKNGKYLGVDGAQKGADYVSAFYDKPKGSHSQFSAIPVTGNTWDEARMAYVSEVYTNAQGVQEIDYCLVKGMTIDRSDAIDIHITANEKPISGSSTINLGSDHTWLIIDNVPPSTVISSYLRYVTIKGKKASNGSNCRVAIFLNGAAVIPTTGEGVMTYQGTTGEYSLNEGNTTTLSARNNTMTSFKLKRGYMATIASGQKGSGYSRVYVADHADLEVTLPEALAKRVSSVNIKPWQYLSKKGWADTGGATRGPELRASWFWSWSAGYSSTADIEFVPCRQHKSWPSKEDVNSKTATAAFSINEPEHSEQHTSDKCSCGGAVDAWYCTTITPDFQASGGRIGSPQPTDFSWMYDYFSKTDGMAYRCDFAVTHAYWNISSRSEADYATWFTDQCKAVWTNTGRPLWITELEMGSSWGEKIASYESNRKYLQVLLQKMEECGWIERYAIYSHDWYSNSAPEDRSRMFYSNDGKITPAGQVYRDHRSTFAYNEKYTKVPVWWTPTAKKPSLAVKQNATTGKFNFTITNPNTDMTEELYVERLMPDGSWQEVARQENRSMFDNETIYINNIAIEDATADNDQFRATVKTLKGVTISSTAGFITNPNIEASSKTNVEGWTMTREANNGNTKATGDTYFEVWDATAANINFNYYQDLTEVPGGIYRLSANVFNTADKVTGACVNGAVGLYAQTADQFYFVPITEDAALDSEATTLTDVPQTTIDRIIVQDDGLLRVGIRNLGTMQARWAGADNFVLQRIGDLKSLDIASEQTTADIALYHLMPETDEGRDASRFITNPDCNRKTSFGWTVSNIDYKADAESYNGMDTNPYWNIWKGSAFTSNLTQTISELPAGTYTFAALLRGQETATMTLSATTPSTSVSQDFKGEGNVSADTDAYPQGWRLVTTAPIEVQRGETLTIALNVKTSAAGWWSADHFALTLTSMSKDAVGIKAAKISTETMDAIYDLSGHRILYPALVKNKIYIIGGKKVLFR